MRIKKKKRRLTTFRLPLNFHFVGNVDKIDADFDSRLAAIGPEEIARAERERLDQEEFFKVMALRRAVHGQSRSEIADRLGIPVERVDYHFARFNILHNHELAVKRSNEIERQKERLTRTLPATAAVLRHALRSHSKGPRESKIAVDASIAINKGLGVLVDKTEVDQHTTIQSLEHKRLEMIARLEIAQEYGAELPDPTTSTAQRTEQEHIDTNKQS